MKEKNQNYNIIKLNTFKSLKDLPHHKAGDICFNTEINPDVYIWANEPQYIISKEMVSDKNFFEQLVLGWNLNEEMFYITLNGLVVKTNYDPYIHTSYVNFGNAFKTKEEAENINEKIKHILNGMDNTKLSE